MVKPQILISSWLGLLITSFWPLMGRGMPELRLVAPRVQGLIIRPLVSLLVRMFMPSMQFTPILDNLRILGISSLAPERIASGRGSLGGALTSLWGLV